jgi:hypothetical protein
MNNKLKFKIIEKFGSQAEFSSVVDEDESAISRIINGRRKLHHQRQRKWANALKCKVTDIFNLFDDIN